LGELGADGKIPNLANGIEGSRIYNCEMHATGLRSDPAVLWEHLMSFRIQKIEFFLIVDKLPIFREELAPSS
jgi:hypothetical protein